MTVVKSFLFGAITALSVSWMVQRWVLLHERKKKNKDNRHDDNDNDDDDVRNVIQQQLVLDSPYLETRILRKAEGVIRKRTSRLVVVVERCTNTYNYSAILRTVEALGIQHLYIINNNNNTNSNNSSKLKQQQHVNTNDKATTPATFSATSNRDKTLTNISQDEMRDRTMHHLFARGATEWLTLHDTFDNTTTCFTELRQKGYTIWATDLGQAAICLTKHDLRRHHVTNLPKKLAIVFGTEAVGCTTECLDAADMRVYLPLRGFADSLNLSVAAALVVQQLFVLDPTIIGSMTEAERYELRQSWFPRLASRRLLTKGQKKHKTRLETKLRHCRQLQRWLDDGKTLQVEQIKKLQDMSTIQHELDTLNVDLERRARLAVTDWIDNPLPPLLQPLTDMRRPNEHRTCYVGRKTKKRNAETWQNMPATTNTYRTENGVSSSEYFRNRAAAAAAASGVQK